MYRILAVDPGSTNGIAVAEVSTATEQWKFLHVGQTNGARGVLGVIEQWIVDYEAVILVENYHWRDMRVMQQGTTMTTMVILGGVQWWAQTHVQPTNREYYPIRLQEPPPTQRVATMRKVLGSNPGNGQDHAHVAAAHIATYMAKVYPTYKLVPVDQAAIWHVASLL